MPETPVAKAPPRVAPTPTAEAPKPAVATPAPPVAQATGGSGSVIQLGAFANQAQAERAWTALSARFPQVAALNKMIVPFSGGIRLRASAASPAEAKQACQVLKAAGENCFVAQ
jgi:cell division septation protein DedD